MHIVIVHIQNLKGIAHTCLIFDLPVIDNAADVEKVRKKALEQFIESSDLPKDQLRNNNVALIHQIYWA
jgi:hypothetical protein